MEINTPADYLDVMRQALEPGVKAASVETDEDGEPKLICVTNAPFDENSEITYMIWPEEDEDTLPMFNIVIMLFDGIDASLSDDIRAIIGRANLYVMTGGFSFIRATSSVVSSHSFYFDTEMTLGDVTLAAAKSLEIMESDIFVIGGLLAKVINGEMTGSEAVASLSESFGDKE